MNPYALEAPPAAAPARRRLPSKEQLTYAKEAMVVVLLALAFPWLVIKLLTRPNDVIKGGFKPV